MTWDTSYAMNEFVGGTQRYLVLQKMTCVQFWGVKNEPLDLKSFLTDCESESGVGRTYWLQSYETDEVCL